MSKVKKSQITDRGVEKRSSDLDGLKIAVAVCGGIASVEVVKIIRELRRHGAAVQAFFTPGVTRFITELPVEWASGQKVVKSEGAEVEYLTRYDLVLVAPATLNTISKSALGLTDNVVTLLIATQLGRKGKLCFVPTMNAEMAEHPLFKEYSARLTKWGAKFYEGTIEEGRLKMPEPEKLVAWIVKKIKE